MDTAVFLVKREEIQKRMEERRTLYTENSSHSSGLLMWLLSQGAHYLSPLASNDGRGRWTRSLLWTVVGPLLLGMVRGGSNVFLKKLVHVVFPGGSSKESARK